MYCNQKLSISCQSVNTTVGQAHVLKIQPSVIYLHRVLCWGTCKENVHKDLATNIPGRCADEESQLDWCTQSDSVTGVSGSLIAQCLAGKGGSMTCILIYDCLSSTPVSYTSQRKDININISKYLRNSQTLWFRLQHSSTCCHLV